MHANDQRSKFALAVLHKTLQHFDSGGTVLGGPTALQSNVGEDSEGLSKGVNTYTNPGGILGGKGSVANQIFNPVGELIGLNQNQFQAQAAPIQQGTNAAQLNTAYDQSQNGISFQQALINELKNQKAIENQSANYSALNNVVNGTGPNPAQAMLNNSTGQNVENQAALMASQRGAGVNPGMVARQTARQGADIQQNAVGQGAALQAKQSLDAMNAQSGIAQNQVNQYGQAVTGLNNAVQNEQSILQNANNAYNNANVGMVSNMNNVNSGVAAGNQSARNGLFGGLLNGVSSMAAMFAEGGEVEADLGDTAFAPQAVIPAPNIGAPPAPIDQSAAFKKSGGGGGGGGMGSMLSFNHGGSVPGGPISHAGKWLNSVPQPMACGGKVQMMANSGGRVPGKAAVQGDSYKNDTIPAMLSSKEIVLPRSVTMSKDPAAAAAKFVQAIMAKKQGLRKAS